MGITVDLLIFAKSSKKALKVKTDFFGRDSLKKL